MRVLFALLCVSPLIAGCTPYIPVKDDFGTSALAPSAPIPPEFAAFNAYDPQVNGLLATQYCATPYQPLDTQSLAAAAGTMVMERGRCQTHIPAFGP